MTEEFEAFVLYYTAWHEGELSSLSELKNLLLEEIGQEGFGKALHIFKAKRLERQAAGDKRTLYDCMKEKKP